MNAASIVATPRDYCLTRKRVFRPLSVPDAIAAVPSKESRAHLASFHAAHLAQSSPFFNRERFLAACEPKLKSKAPVGGERQCAAQAAPAAGGPPGLSIGHISPQPEKTTSSVELWEEAFLLQVRRPGIGKAPPASARRGTVAGFSGKSRLRLMVTVNKVAMREGRMPLFVTCTFPDAVPAPDDVARIWDNFCRALERCFPSAGLIWKKELKTRLSGVLSTGKTVPHFHALAWGLPELVPCQERRGKWFSVRRVRDGWRWRMFALNEGGERIAVEDTVLAEGRKLPFTFWLSALWYEAVGTGDYRHLKAGTNLSQVRSVAGVRFYVSKYMGKDCDGGSEWACGRWWGVRRKGNIPWGKREAIELTTSGANRLVRCVRRYIKATRGRKVKLLGSTVNLFTGDSAQWRRLAEWLARVPS